VPGAIQAASSSGPSCTTVTGRQMWSRSPPFSRYRHRMRLPGAQYRVPRAVALPVASLPGPPSGPYLLAVSASVMPR
jgi:hypothetical protein